MEFSPEEYADIHFLYGFCDGNSRQAAEEYRRRYPNRRQPHRNVFQTVHRNMREGFFSYRRRYAGRPLTADDEEVLALFARNPSLSVRQVAAQTNNSPATVWRIARKDRLHPYHIQRVQCLLPADYGRRMQFCRRLIAECQENENFVNKVLWTDESTFSRTGIFNSHNQHFWSVENPRKTRETSFQLNFSVNVWAGIIDKHIIGPYFFSTTLNGNTYLNFLRNELNSLMDSVPLSTRRDMWFQQDGAPPHFATSVRTWLNNSFPRRWIGRCGEIAWPARSPDLNPLDFYFWGYLKTLVYQIPVNTREELKERILNAFNIIRSKPQQVKTSKSSLMRRCRLCIQTNGGHFEHLL